MSISIKRFGIFMSICFVLILIITGCKSKNDIKPAAREIFEDSSAAGFLALRVEESEGFISNSEDNGETNESAFIYDNALALMALSKVDAKWHVEKIADAIVFAQEHDRKFNDGRLRNAYIGGNPKSDSGRSIVGGEVTVRLPGFWKDGLWQEDPYTVSTSTGNMAFVIMSLCRAAEVTSEGKKEEYILAASKAADFILTLKEGDGGFSAGYEGWDEAQKKATYKSTEHNINLVFAFKALAKAIEDIDSEKQSIYLEASEHAKEFVLSMYDKNLHCFYTGTKEDGKTINKGVIPIDSNSLAILAFGKELDDVYSIISFLEKRMSVGSGFDFSAGDLDGIWNEGTAQMAICYKVFGDEDKYQKVMRYLDTQSLSDGSIPAADRDGVSTGFVVNGTDVLWEFNNSLSISSTSWYAFAQMGINIFDL